MEFEEKIEKSLRNPLAIGNHGLLKGILKPKSTLSYIDFKNELRISNDNDEIISGTIDDSELRRPPTRPGDMIVTKELSDFLQERQQKDDDSYFFPTSSSRMTRGGSSSFVRRECESSSSLSTSSPPTPIKENYKNALPISLFGRSSSGIVGIKCQNNYNGRPGSASLTRKFIIRFFQLTSMLLIIIGILSLVAPSIFQPKVQEKLLLNSSESSPTYDIRSSLQEWSMSILDTPFNTSLNSLLDIPNFHYLLNNINICNLNTTSEIQGVYFLILVHSAPDNFNERQSIRTTWGSVKTWRNWAIRLVFLLGQQNPPQGETLAGILNESDMYGDIVTGNFEDTYRNLTYKHIMGYKWAVSYCPLAKFIIKTDDDAFVDVFQIFDFVQRNYGTNPMDILLCNIYPEGTKPVRNSSQEVKGDENGAKWIVTNSEYPFPIYPKYCGGLGYLITMDVIERLLTVTKSLKKFLWIDDVFVTGIIRELANKEPFYLNLRYSYDEYEYKNWLDDRSSRKRLSKNPFMFIHVTRGSGFIGDMSRLWRKTVRTWS